MLLSSPPAVAVTSTVTVQVAPAATAGKAPMPLASRVITLVPASAVRVGGSTAVPQVVEALAGSAISIPVGRLSVKSRLSTFEALAMLLIVKVRVLLPPRGTIPGAKILENPGRVVATVRSTGDDVGGSLASSL